MWFLLAVGTAVFFAAQGALSKRLTGDYHPDLVTWGAFVFSFPIYIAALLLSGIPDIKLAFWPFMATSLSLNFVAIPLLFRALKHGDLSIVLPLSTLTPFFTLFTQYLLLGDVPTPKATAGILLVVAGAYLLHAGSIRSGLLAPFRVLARDKGARMMVGASALWSITAVADRGAVLAASAPFYLAVFSSLFTLLFPVWIILKRPGELRSFRERPWPLLPVGLAGAAMALCQMFALGLALAATVTSVKRLSALFGVVLGGLLFKEKGMAIRLLASLVMVAGTVLLATE